MTHLGDRTGFYCPQCNRQVFLRNPVHVPLPTGAVAVNVGPLVAAMSLHLRAGCEATR